MQPQSFQSALSGSATPLALLPLLQHPSTPPLHFHLNAVRRGPDPPDWFPVRGCLEHILEPCVCVDPSLLHSNLKGKLSAAKDLLYTHIHSPCSQHIKVSISSPKAPYLLSIIVTFFILMNFIGSSQSFSSINDHFIHNHKRCLWQYPGDLCRMDSKPKPTPTTIGVPSLPTTCQAEIKLRVGNIPNLLPRQAQNKSCPINVRVNVLIHWSNIVAIQSSVLRSGPEIMRFLCTLVITPNNQAETKAIAAAGCGLWWACCFNRLKGYCYPRCCLRARC